MLYIRLLLFALVGITLINAIVALYLYRKTRVPGSDWWFLGASLVAACALLFGLRGMVHDAISVVMANGLGMLGYGFIWQGMRSYSGKKATRNALVIIACIAVFGMAESYFFTFIIPSVELRLQIGAFLLFLFSSFSANALAFSQNRNGAVILTCVLFVVSAIINALRCILVIIVPSVGSYLISVESVPLFFFVYCLYFIFLAIAQVYLAYHWDAPTSSAKNDISSS